MNKDLTPGVASALRKLAMSPALREAFAADPLLRDTLWPAASRYVVAGDRDVFLARIGMFDQLGYRRAVEFVGEEVTAPEEIEQVVAEYEGLIDAADPWDSTPIQLGFDLSSVGSLISAELAYDNTAKLLKAAAAKNITIILSMERSSFVDRILEVHGALAREHDNVGITMQAQLHRTPADVTRVVAAGGKVRLVKGVYKEDPSVAIPRGPELDRRYVELVRDLTEQGMTVSAATQDPKTVRLLDQFGLLERVEEVEMLHGVRPNLLRRIRDRGIPARLYAVYGRNWWLHFLHRLAEHPPNVMVALADLDDPRRIQFGRDYV